MKPVIYIDGQAGTTGLQIMDRLSRRDDITLLRIEERLRHDNAERKRLINAADLVFLCLPDKAAVEAAALAERPGVRIIDASTAHRTHPDWAYGFPELSPRHRARIAEADRVANPGCHASGFISIVYPLVEMGLLDDDAPLTCFSLTGYSGGGKGMIADYERPDRPTELSSPRLYGLSLNHKHLPEMQKVCHLRHAPVFCPVVDDYYKGMATTVPLPAQILGGGTSAKTVHEALTEHYRGQALVTVAPLGWDQPMIAANTLAGRDGLTLIVCGGGDRITVTALFDNLGKGASGAAVQNMNLMLGFPETAGLNL